MHVYVWKQAGSITVTDTSLAFFQDLVPGVAKGAYASRIAYLFETLLTAVAAYADGFVNIVATYAAPNGSLSEQFSRDDGHPLSARDLTWSYAAFLTAAARRAGIVPSVLVKWTWQCRFRQYMLCHIRGWIILGCHGHVVPTVPDPNEWCSAHRPAPKRKMRLRPTTTTTSSGCASQPRPSP